jgi:hypothetical protein
MDQELCTRLSLFLHSPYFLSGMSSLTAEKAQEVSLGAETLEQLTADSPETIAEFDRAIETNELADEMGYGNLTLITPSQIIQVAGEYWRRSQGDNK